jgi:hypothetical protein
VTTSPNAGHWEKPQPLSHRLGLSQSEALGTPRHLICGTCAKRPPLEISDRLRHSSGLHVLLVERNRTTLLLSALCTANEVAVVIDACAARQRDNWKRRRKTSSSLSPVSRPSSIAVVIDLASPISEQST